MSAPAPTDITDSGPAWPASRLDLALLTLLRGRRTAALGTLADDGEVSLSMVPYAIEPASGAFVALVSGLAAHTQQLQVQPRASLLICDSEDRSDHVHALSRISLQVDASWPTPGSAEADSAAKAYLARHAAAQMLTELPDFRWVRLRPLQARHVAGFGAARTIDRTRLLELMGNNLDQRR